MYPPTQSNARLMRSSSGLIGGVCAGLSAHFGINLAFVRLIFILLTLAYGIGPLLYIVLVLVLPIEPAVTLGTEPNAVYGHASTAGPPARRKTIFSYIAGAIAGISAVISFASNVGAILDFVPTIVPHSSVPTTMPWHFVPTTEPDTSVPTPVPTPFVSSFPTSINGEYTLRTVSDTDRNLKITRVTIDDTQTTVHFRFYNATGEDANISVSRPSDPRAFYIASTDLSRIFPLRDIEGIAIQPQYSLVSPGETLEFTLIFDRIDDSMTRFHLVEGVADDPEVTEWVFQNVTLK